ncbi:protein FATTY ACID EXPORT 3, chloroplastic-like isoform X2 [Apium graveolens]|uniref:protein FATTY ACID EXPORT 3, chloroplastic-like isoform X2 n=1 Tax=Apium graveolens TaxID=4045 RepID=UPI003D78FBD6
MSCCPSFTIANPNCRLITMSTCSIPFHSSALQQHSRTSYKLPSLPLRRRFPLTPLLLHHHCIHRNNNTRSAFSFAASKHDSPLETEGPEEHQDTPIEGNESEEYWNQTLASFKEQALKMQSVSQEAYEEFSKRAIVILGETSKQLKIQAEKAKKDLAVIAEEVSKESKQYLSKAADESPEPVKDIVQTFASSSNELNEVSQVRDFYIGIPYGTLLSFSGFLSFMITGSISALRFGVILGGALLALSISSLRSWKNGESSLMALRGQTAIASILFLRDMRILFVRSSFSSFVTAFVSGAMVGFYIYRIILGAGGDSGGSNLEPGKES